MTVNGLLGVGANVSLVVGSYGIVRYGFRQPRGVSTGLGTALVFWVACTIGLEILGTLGALAVGPMLAWGMLVGGIGGVCWWFRARNWVPRLPDRHLSSPCRGTPFCRCRCYWRRLWFWG